MQVSSFQKLFIASSFALSYAIILLQLNKNYVLLGRGFPTLFLLQIPECINCFLADRKHPNC